MKQISKQHDSLLWINFIMKHKGLVTTRLEVSLWHWLQLKRDHQVPSHPLVLYVYLRCEFFDEQSFEGKKVASSSRRRGENFYVLCCQRLCPTFLHVLPHSLLLACAMFSETALHTSAGKANVVLSTERTSEFVDNSASFHLGHSRFEWRQHGFQLPSSENDSTWRI